MKILNVSTISPKIINSIHNNPAATTATNPIGANTPAKDVISFSGKDDESICDNFGLLKEDYADFENSANITNLFNTTTKENDNKKLVMDKFFCNTRDKKIGFFGDEVDFAKALNNKEIRPDNFDASSNAKFSMISYENDGVRYNLKYNKTTHQLVSGSAEIIKNNPDEPMERIAIKPSKNNEGEYIAHYQFINDKNGERAIEDTYVLFDKNLQAKASHTDKSFQYSDGEKEVQKFARTYDEEGMPAIADVIEYAPYIW